ncbi:GNAT family N-acetyltransferase [Pseudomonas lalucatii]|uniref:GNAT family N-acetyltransferase n=1 Tax=Pseudomonas lalucatii TaxID=1424203 RepID=A0ABS5Q522_9PSED|nr:GNAT family N-acetyltransferase [Pseudomonas lalucatii]MBS7663744.1 GNAT family N-acetyltransferase [Pseudomonas lalucatii]MBS7689697.1 GNAT family N-acetyltransferase [Pseudomonas lalucatii]MBS7725191.1 GNAT family N-acetyltransferase [Pseudomonas lalucatii]QVM86848.1 GNAT family N-acetyltransferase [Pseudomonas lalucatii]
MDIRLLQGAAIEPYIPDLARLRIEVFREFPYLYDGSLDYETDYLNTYARSADSLVVLVLDHERVVGASTGLPLADETAEFQRPFLEQGWDAERIFYFGESVLLPAYRGQGLGVGFFAKREGFARRLGRFDWCAFCAVERPLEHPRRPGGYQPLDAFWARRGYSHHPELRTEFVWQDLDEKQESAKPLSFWLKEIRP